MRTNLESIISAAIALLLLPSPAGAQGGDAVFRSLRVEIPIERRFLEPQGLQDAASDLLTTDVNVMSTTYTTVLSGTVTTGEAGDAVTVHVTGQFGLMYSLYVAGRSDDELWRIDDPATPGAATLAGAFPAGLGGPEGITSYGGALYVVDDTGDELWRIDDPTTPGAATLAGAFPAGLGGPAGITSHGGALFVVDSSDDELWRIDDPATPGAATLAGAFPAGLTLPVGVTSHGGALYVVDDTGDELWRIDDPTTPGAATLAGAFPAGLGGPAGITSHGGALFVVDSSDDELWRIDDPATPGAATLAGAFPAGLDTPAGIASVDPEGACMIRLARGTTEIEAVSFTTGRVLFDTTFTDAPGPGTHTYNVQVRTVQQGGCTAYRGDGLVPMPSMLVQSYYAGVIP